MMSVLMSERNIQVGIRNLTRGAMGFLYNMLEVLGNKKINSNCCSTGK